MSRLLIRHRRRCRLGVVHAVSTMSLAAVKETGQNRARIECRENSEYLKFHIS